MFSTLETDNLPAVLLDPVIFSYSLQIRDTPPSHLADFLAALVRFKAVEKWSGFKNTTTLTLKVPGGGHVKCTIRPAYAEGHLVALNGEVEMNCLLLLRAAMGLKDRKIKGLDKKCNLVGVTKGRERELLAKQLSCVWAAMETFVEAIEQALPIGAVVVEERLSLKKAEATLDLAMPGAIAVVRSLKKAPLPGSTQSSDDTYCVQHRERKGVPECRFWRKKTGAAHKAYPKQADLLRLEISCLNPEAVKKQLGDDNHRSSVDGEQAVDLLLAFAHAAEPGIEELEAHALATLVNPSPLAELVLDILPLIQLASGKVGGRGRPSSPATIAAAKAALEALLATGCINFASLGRPASLKPLLESLSSETGPLNRRGHRAIFVLRPRFAQALANQ